MKIKIDEIGFISIERNGKMRSQCCPFTATSAGGLVNCGDWCPLFGEPEPFSFDPITGDPTDSTIELDLCSKTLSINVEDFEDER